MKRFDRAKTLGLLATALTLCAVAAFAQTPATEEKAEAMDKETKQASAPKVTEYTVAIIETTKGDITVKFYTDVAPKAVENFVGLSAKGYYDGVIFHRIIKGFMMQGGDPTGTGYGGQSLWGQPFEDEVSKEYGFSGRGLLAMANSGPRTNGSQFFITFKATPWLDGKHTIFGEVIEGSEVVDTIESVDTDPRDKPIEELKIVTIRIEERTPEKG